MDKQKLNELAALARKEHKLCVECLQACNHSCPKSEDDNAVKYFGKEDRCNCGAAEHNEKVNALLKALLENG